MTTTINNNVRSGSTSGVQATGLTPNSAVKENSELKSVLKGLKEACQEGGASSTVFLPAAGVKYDAWSFSYHTGISKEMNIKNVKEGAKIQGHIAINISGHATGGRPEQVAAMALEKLASEHKIDLSKNNAKNDKLFDQILTQAKSAGWSGDVTIKVDGLPEIKLAAADIQKFGSTDEGKWAGNEALRRNFAMTNTYNIRVTLPDGQKLEMRNIPRNKTDQAEYSTKIPIEFPAQKGTTIIEAWPTGSAEVAGYVEARQYKMHVGKESFYDEAKGIEAAEKFMDAHPQVRWASRADPPDTDIAVQHEEEDMKKFNVHPLPYPYGDGA